MIYVEINDVRHPATVNGKTKDSEWDGRHSKTITLAMSYETARATFVDGLAWAIVMQDDPYTDPETGEEIVPEPEYHDNSEFCVAGDITDHRNGIVSVKMGMLTEVEALRKQLANAVTEEELTAAYVEGVNSL